MTTTAAATVRIAGNPLLELLYRVDHDNRTWFGDEQRQDRLCDKARSLGLMRRDRAKGWVLTPAGRDILRACTGVQLCQQYELATR